MNQTNSHVLQILIVDDDPVVRLAHSAVLREQGYVVTQAENGEQAVDQTQKRMFDLILMDINMPKMNGLEATQKIRDYENGQFHTPIIGITSQDESNRESGLRKGMDAVIGKPIGAEQLKEIVRQAMVIV